MSVKSSRGEVVGDVGLDPRTRRPTTRSSQGLGSSLRRSSRRRSRSASTTWSGRALFAREEVRIRAVLGDACVRLEHAGSTSVPALAAKPIIDIVLEVPDSADEAAYAADLEAARLSADDPRARVVRAPRLQGPDTNVNLHVFTAGCEETERMLALPRLAAENAADRERYAAAKRELAAQDWTYVQQYADAKTAVVREIMARAESEKRPVT